MEALHMSVVVPCLPRKSLRLFHRSFNGSSQLFRNEQLSRSQVSGGRIGDAERVLVRARQRGGGGGVGDDENAKIDGKKSIVTPNLDVEGRRTRRPLWQRGLGFVERKLGFGEPWEEDPRGRLELEELDLFLEGQGADIRWKDVLEPSVENILALVLTGLFLYAIVLIGWQLLLVAAAITLSALKYAVIAAILLGVLIFFL